MELISALIEIPFRREDRSIVGDNELETFRRLLKEVVGHWAEGRGARTNGGRERKITILKSCSTGHSARNFSNSCRTGLTVLQRLTEIPWLKNNRRKPPNRSFHSVRSSTLNFELGTLNSRFGVPEVARQEIAIGARHRVR